MPFLPQILRAGGKNRSEYLRAQIAEIYMREGIFSKGKKTRPILPQKAPGKASFHAKIHWETPGRMDDRIVGEFSSKSQNFEEKKLAFVQGLCYYN